MMILQLHNSITSTIFEKKLKHRHNSYDIFEINPTRSNRIGPYGSRFLSRSTLRLDASI